MDRFRVIQLLKEDEGFRQKVYLDTKGIPTIGYGRNLRDTGVSEKEAEFLLANDIDYAEHQCQQHFSFWSRLPGQVQDVLVCLAMNMGMGYSARGLLSFEKMLAAIETGQWEQAAAELVDSQWAQDVGPLRTDKMASLLRTAQV